MKENTIITGALIILGTFMSNTALAASSQSSGNTHRKDRIRTYKSQVIAYSGTSIPHYTGGLFIGLTAKEHKNLKNMTDDERKTFLEGKGIVIPETIVGDAYTGTTIAEAQAERTSKTERQMIKKIEKKLRAGDTLSQREKNFASVHNIKY